MAKKKVVYYAHPMTTYGSTIEKADIKILEDLGFEVYNPNNPIHQIGCKEYARIHGADKIMEYFTNIIFKNCEAVAFRALPDGRLLSGVAYEVNKSVEHSLPVFELPNSLLSRSMDYPATKEYLTQVGFYKTSW